MTTPGGGRPSDGLPGLCRHLRSKRYYYGTVDQARESAELSTTAQYWCLRTMRVVGPDQGAVSVAACRYGRACCDPADA